MLDNKKGGRFSQAVNPNWDNAKYQSDENYEIIEAPLKNRNAFTFSSKDSDISASGIRTTLKLLIIKSKESGTLNATIMYIYALNGKADNINYVSRTNLTGIVLFTDLQGTLVNGWRYNNGKVSHTITKKEPSGQSNALTLRVNGKSNGSYKTLAESEYCDEYTINWYERTCNYYTDGSSVCGLWTYSHSTTSDNCEGSGNGGYQFQQKDCAGVVNGTARMDSCGCIGGTTGRIQCPPPCNTFEIRVVNVINTEGGFTNDPNDSGGLLTKGLHGKLGKVFHSQSSEWHRRCKIYKI